MNLYEIDREITEAFENAVDQETGEIVNEDAYCALDQLQMMKERKMEGIALWIKNLNAEADALKKEKQAFEARQKSSENKAESLKRYLSNVLNGEKFKTDKVSVTWRKSESADYSGDISTLPESCIRIKEPELNKTELKRLLKEGKEIDGAQLVAKQNIQIK